MLKTKGSKEKNSASQYARISATAIHCRKLCSFTGSRKSSAAFGQAFYIRRCRQTAGEPTNCDHTVNQRLYTLWAEPMSEPERGLQELLQILTLLLLNNTHMQPKGQQGNERHTRIHIITRSRLAINRTGDWNSNNNNKAWNKPTIYMHTTALSSATNTLARTNITYAQLLWQEQIKIINQ